MGKEYGDAVYSQHAYITYMQSASCKMLGWMNQKPESRLSGEKNKKKRKLRKQKQINKNTIVQGSINNLRYAGNITLMAKKRRDTKDPLHEGEREE